MNPDCFHNDAFSRNLGLISQEGQRKLNEARVAVAGAGGVGGLHLLTLARLGVGNFNVADFDTFEVANINRQFGAMSSTCGKPKASVLAQMIQDINPASGVKVFSEGVTESNIDSFLSGVDVFVDGIDFFEISIRRLIFRYCKDNGIFAVTSAPLGFGATLQVFAPDGMSFDDYFNITDEMPRLMQIAAFAAGLAPRPYHIKYLDMSKVDIERQRGPAVAPACTLASSLVGTEVVKLITKIGEVKAAPNYLQIDLVKQKLHRGRLMFGGRGPLQLLKRWLIMRKALAQQKH